jgi:hypothetical protein
MILRVLEDRAHSAATGSAWGVFMAAEKNAHPPCGIILQADHARLAGDLARALRTEPFGAFPDEVIEAAAQHDFGWQDCDLSQLRQIGKIPPEPFPRLSLEQTLAAWNACIDHARSLPPLTDVLISRHFSTLAGNDPGRESFVQAERSRRSRIEGSLPYSAEDLERWTGVVGFCDLLSLYLCCGARRPVEFPLAHPASEASKHATRVKLSWNGGRLEFSAPILRLSASFMLAGQIYGGSGSQTTPIDFTWSFE